MDKLFLAAIKEETIGLDYFNHVGVGKINATYNTLKLINIHKPKLIINYGTAGAINTKLKEIVECTKFYQRDMDVDMEAYAIAKVCKLENIEFKCFKYISDNADKNADNDWGKNLAKGATAFASLISAQF